MIGANESRIELNRSAVGKTAISLVSPRPQQLTPSGPGRDGLEDAEADQLLDESDTAVGEQEVGATRVKRPVLVAMGEARGRVGPVSFASVREDECPASFGVEARFGLERHQRNGRVGDGARPARARQVLAPLARGEGLACAVPDPGDLDRVIAEEKAVAGVAPRGAVIGVDDVGIEAGGVPAPDRANMVRRGNVTNNSRSHCNRQLSESQSNPRAPKRYASTNCLELISPPERGLARTPH